MKSTLGRLVSVLIVACAGLALATASHEALDVPDLAVLEQKFGSFEGYVRGKVTDASKAWFDQAPTVFDGASRAWSRAITCTKNLADNAALIVFGKVSEAYARSNFAKQKQELLKQAVFSSEAPANVTVPNSDEVKSQVVTSAQTTFIGKLSTCFKTQVAMVGDLFAQANDRFARDMFSPAGVAAQNNAKPVQNEIESGFGALQKQAEMIIREATTNAAQRAQAVPNMALTAAMFVNPTLGGSVYCGDKVVCMNGGRCVAQNMCACPADWRGPSCTEPVNTCVSLGIQCAGQSVCTAPEGVWQCNCPASFAGLYCERYDPSAPATPQPTVPPLPQIALAHPQPQPQLHHTSAVSAALLRKLRPYLGAQMPIRDFRIANAAQAALDRRSAAQALSQASLLEVQQDNRVEADVVESHTAQTSMDDMYI